MSCQVHSSILDFQKIRLGLEEKLKTNKNSDLQKHIVQPNLFSNLSTIVKKGVDLEEGSIIVLPNNLLAWLEEADQVEQ